MMILEIIKHSVDDMMNVKISRWDDIMILGMIKSEGADMII